MTDTKLKQDCYKIESALGQTCLITYRDREYFVSTTLYHQHTYVVTVVSVQGVMMGYDLFDATSNVNDEMDLVDFTRHLVDIRSERRGDYVADAVERMDRAYNALKRK